jgi:tRNA-specific 2-thiouridylase
MKIMVGLSGGVDSSVALSLLQQQGHEVEALFMKNWVDDDSAEYCASASDLADAQAVCDRLNLPLHQVNFANEYWQRVFEHFLAEYAAGRTPNPDILCNKEIKFRAFLDYAKALGAEKIATGHYAQNRWQEDRWQLVRGIDSNKDQSYFLYTLNQQQLASSLFPVGHLAKPEVRRLAKAANLPTFAKKDSTGICFIGERRFKDFLQTFLPAKPGLIQSLDGKTIAEHHGLMYYTLGQRQGLKIGGLKQGSEAPWFVAHKDVDTNVLTVVQGHDHPALYRSSLSTQAIHWIAGTRPLESCLLTAKIRYRQQDQLCRLEEQANGCFNVFFSEPQWAVTAGQSIVFYDGDICLGGGVIA